MKNTRLILAGLFVAAAAAFWWFDLYRFLDLEVLRDQLDELQALVGRHRIAASALFFVSYATLASLSVPGAALVFTLGGGALFGTAWGSVLVSFASSIGGTVACLLSRFLLREFVEKKFPYAVERVNRGIREDGAYYLFGLRLVPVFPFFIINLVMGLTRLPLRTFYWVSQLGMLPGTVIFVNAGTQLAQVESAGEILAPDVALSLALLGVFPLVSKKIANAVMAWHRKHP